MDFTTVSGIWQTVWLEVRPAAHITQAHITPDVPNERAMISVTVESPVSENFELQINIQYPDGRTVSQT